MGRSYLPRREVDLDAWAAVFAAKLVESPETYGVTPQIASEYSQLRLAYSEALQRATSGKTRGVLTIEEKNAARKSLVERTRQLVRQVQAMGIDNAQRLALGLNPAVGRRRVVPRPKRSPSLAVRFRPDWTIQVEVCQAEASGKARPAESIGMIVFMFTGNVPPKSPSDWQFVATTTRTSLSLRSDVNPFAGERLWVTAAWLSPRLQLGPLADPVECPALPACLPRPALAA